MAWLQRGRPGRRTAEDRTAAVIELLSGKASVDTLARRFGVTAETIEKWREEALAGLAEAMRCGGKTRPGPVLLGTLGERQRSITADMGVQPAVPKRPSGLPVCLTPAVVGKPYTFGIDARPLNSRLC